MSDHDIRDRIAAQLASPQWALMRRSPNVTDERGVSIDDQPATFDQRFPSRSFQLDHDPNNPVPAIPPATRLGVDAGAVDLDVAAHRMMKR